MQTLELRYIIASFECRLLLAYQQQQQSCNDIRECHRQKCRTKTKIVDHPTQDSAPDRPYPECQREVETESHIANGRTGLIRKICLQERTLSINSKSHQNQCQWNEPQRHTRACNQNEK